MASEPVQRLLGSQSPGPFPQRTYTPLWRSTDPHPSAFYLLGKSILWFDTHYQEGVVPCIASFAPKCTWCSYGWRPRPRGFIGGMLARTGGVYLLTVTQGALASCPALAVAGGVMRGMPVTVRRRGHGKNSAWMWTIESVPAPKSLPPAPDVFDAVERLWGIDLRRINAHPPTDGDITPMFRLSHTNKGQRR